MNTRQLVKRTIKNLFLLLAFPIYLFYQLLSMAGNPDSTFMSFSQGLSLVPGKLGIYLRAAFYRLTCPDTSDEISIGFLTIFSHRDTTIHRGVYIGPQCNIGKCQIGKDTLVGSGVHILSGSRQHEFQDTNLPIQEQSGQYEKITIGSDCWVGNQAVVMSPIDEKSIIAAGSVVVRPVQRGDLVAGNPARVLRNRFNESHASIRPGEADQ